MDTDLSLIIKTVLDTSGISIEIAEIQNILDSYHFTIQADIDKEQLTNSINEVLPNIINDLNLPLEITIDNESLSEAIETINQEISQVSSELQNTADIQSSTETQNNHRLVSQHETEHPAENHDYDIIAASAKGYNGVHTAIQSYNNASDAEQFRDAISKTNPVLAEAMKHYSDGTMSMKNYATALTVAKLKTIALKVATSAMNMAVDFAISTLINVAVTAFTNYTNRIEKSKESLEDSLSAYKEVTQEVKDLEDKLKTCGQRIEELQKLSAKGKISLTDAKELIKLKNENDELERNLNLKKAKQVTEQKKVLVDNKGLLSKTIKSTFNKVPVTDSGKKVSKRDTVTIPEELHRSFQKYNSVKRHEDEELEKSSGSATAQEHHDKSIKAVEDEIDEYYEIIEPSLDAYQQITEAGGKLTDAETAEYNSLLKLQEEYLLYCYNVKGVTDAYNSLSAAQKKKMILDKLEAQGLSSEQSNATYKSMSKDDIDNFNTLEFTFTPPKEDDYKSTEEYGKAYSEAMHGGNSKNNEKSSFKNAWSSLDTTKSDELKRFKSDILALAEAGKLTEDTFNNTTGSDTFLDMIKLSARGTIDEVNKLIDDSKQLSSLKTSISSIRNAYGEKEDNKFVSSDTFANMEGEFGGLGDTWENYKKTLGSTSSELKDCKKAQNDLATAYINSNSFLSKLTDQNKEYYVSQLEGLGISNAEQVVNNALQENKANEILLNCEIINSDESDAESKARAIEMLEGCTQAAKEYAYQKALANDNSLDTSDSVGNLITLAKQCGTTGEALNLLTSLQANLTELENLNPNDQYAGEKAANIRSENIGINERLKEISSKNPEKTKASDIDVSTKNIGSKGNNTKDKEKSTKSLFNWIEIKLDRINKKIEKFKSLMDAALSFDTKKFMGIEALNQMGKEYSANQKAASKYKKKADNSFSKKDRDQLKKKGISVKDIEEGKVKLSTVDDKTKSKIDTYKDYYDKSQACKQSNIELIKSMQDLAESVYNLPFEKAEKDLEKYSQKADLASATLDNAKNFTEKKTQRNIIMKSARDTLDRKTTTNDETLGALYNLTYTKKVKKNGKKVDIDYIKGTKIKATGKEIDVLNNDGTSKYSGKTLTAVNEYNKALKANEKATHETAMATQEFTTTIREQMLGSLQDIMDDTETARGKEAADTNLTLSKKDAKEASGQIVTRDDWNQIVIEATKDVQSTDKSLNELKDQWDKTDKSTLSQAEIDDWDTKILNLEAELYNAEKIKAEYVKQQNNQEIANLNSQLDLLKSMQSEYSALLALHDAQGVENRNPDEIKEQLDNFDKQLPFLEEQRRIAQENANTAYSEGRGADYLKYQAEANGYSTQIYEAKTAQENLVDELFNEQINKINKTKEALQKANDEQDRRLKLEKAHLNLLKAQNQKTQKVFNGSEYVYQADEDAIKAAQEELNNLEFDNLINSLDKLTEAIEERKKEVNIYDADGTRILSNDEALTTSQTGAQNIGTMVATTLEAKGYDMNELLKKDYSSLMKNAVNSLNEINTMASNYESLKELMSKPNEKILNISIGDINLSQVNNAVDLANRIIEQLPNTISHNMNY